MHSQVLRPVTDRERWMRIQDICDDPESHDVNTLRHLLYWLEEERDKTFVRHPATADKARLCRALKKQQSWVSWINPFSGVAHAWEGAKLGITSWGSETDYLKWLKRRLHEITRQNKYIRFVSDTLLEARYEDWTDVKEYQIEKFIKTALKHKSTAELAAQLSTPRISAVELQVRKALEEVARLEAKARTVGEKFLARGRLYRKGDLTAAQRQEAVETLHFLSDLKIMFQQFLLFVEKHRDQWP